MEHIGKILKIFVISGLMLVLGLLAGKFLDEYSTARSSDGLPSAPVSSLTPGVVQMSAGASSTPEASVEPDTALEAPRRTLSDREFDRMIGEMRREVARFRGRSAIYVKNLENGKIWTHNAEGLFPSASLIKVPVMIGVYEKISGGEIRLDQPLILTKSARRSGSGQLKWRRNGERFTVRELLTEMISVSDNIAQEMLIQTVGLDYLQDRFRTFGLQHTNITRGGLSLASWTRVENHTTAREMALLLEHLYRGRKFGAEASAEMLELMRHVKYQDRLPKYLPQGFGLAHKTGLLRRACHDVGIVYSPAGDYIICVLTSNAPSYRIAKRYISKIGSISYRYFQKPSTSVVTTTGFAPPAHSKPAS